MESHRHLRLIVRAAVDGVIDYSEADTLNPMWHKRVNILLREMIEKDNRDILKIGMQRSLAYLPVSGLTADSWKYHSEKAFDMYDDYYRSVYSLPKTGGDRKQRMAEQLQGAWCEAFGNPKDAEVRDDIDKVVQGLKAANRATRRPLSGN